MQQKQKGPLKQGKEGLIPYILDETSSGPEAAQETIMHQILTEHAAAVVGEGPLGIEGVLSESWIASNGRFGWIDLGAGDFSWGPVAGGTGSKSSSDPTRPPPSLGPEARTAHILLSAGNTAPPGPWGVGGPAAGAAGALAAQVGCGLDEGGSAGGRW
eukprot:CAMPEP_0194664882 /NCGR_PEP_ID=MMETSP0295-20121207/1741_1 /TAXON_ID=39354 /ORGANISM="Heterosigma akashiwo, Strain CCMP2393" /LENGTH=157 /DNA_ID=CAMNT_0039546739 /DNA_START=136 /DNA_END=607 /DNA_ORIENTATION=-